jgi:hypothetical protein
MSTKITDLTELAEAPAAADMIPIVDVSAGTTKKIRADNLTLVGILTSAATAITALLSHFGRLIRCTSASTVTYTVPTGLPVGLTVELFQEGAGQVRVVAGSGMTMRVPAAFNAYTAQQYSTLVVTLIDATTFVVRGDLEGA